MNIIEQQRAVTYYRQAFHDMPVGGPMDGAAYGEYLKSKGIGMVLGVVAAAAAVFTGGASLGLWGAAAGATVSTASAITGGLMMAGGVMTGVGAVSGNQKLMKIGGVLTLAGGIGSLINSGMNSLSSGTSVSAEAAGETATTYGTQAGSAQTAELAAQDAAFGGSKAAMDGMGGKATLTLGDKISGVSGFDAGAQPSVANSYGFDPTGMNHVPPGVDVASQPAASNLTGASSVDPFATTADVNKGFIQNSIEGATPNAPTTPAANAPTTGAPKADNGFTKMTDAEWNANISNGPPAGYSVDGKAPPGGWMEKLENIGKFVKNNKELVEITGKTVKGVGEMYSEGAKDDIYSSMSAKYNAETGKTAAETAAINQAMEQKATSIANRNNIVVQLNPRSPTYQADKAAALAAGKQVVDLPGSLGLHGPTMATYNQVASGPNLSVPLAQR